MEERVRVVEFGLVLNEGFEAQVLDLDESQLFEVGVGVSPPAALVEPNPVGQNLAQRGLGVLKVEALDGRVLEPLGAQGIVGAVEAQGLLLGKAEFVAAQARSPAAFRAPRKPARMRLTKRKSLK